MIKDLVILLLLAHLFSCTSKKPDTARAYSFYDSVNTQLELNRSFREKLMDTVEQMLSIIKGNEDAQFNTKPIHEHLEDVKVDNDQRRRNIVRIIEVDKEIGFKKKALDYIKTMNDFYEKEYEEFLNIVDETQGDRFKMASKILIPKLLEIKEKAREIAAAAQRFEAKYTRNEPAPEDKKTAELFSYKKLSELNYQMIPIPEGTEIRVFSYSGGNCSEVNDIYHQFIGIDQTTNDTIRVLTLCQTMDREVSGPPRWGVFKVNFPSVYNASKADESFVVFNSKMRFIEDRNYKTVVGILEFK